MKPLSVGRQHPRLRGLQGGLSNGVFFNKRMREYLADTFPLVFGYVGSRARCKSFDIIIEKELRKHRLTDDDIVLWMASRWGRGLMDRVEGQRLTDDQFKRTMKGFFEQSPITKVIADLKAET